MLHSWQQLACLIVLFALTTAEKQTRWSRQISSYTADISDWVPLSSASENEQPQIKRQAVAEPRVLAEPLPGPRIPDYVQEPFPSRAYFQSLPTNNQLYLQSVPAVPSAPQNYLNDQGFGQSIRFGLSHPNFGMSQGFISQQYPFDNPKPRPVNPVGGSIIKFDNYPKPNLQLPSPQAKPFVSQSTKSKPEAPKFMDGYRLENTSNNFAYNSKKKPQSLQKLKFENFDKIPSLPLPPVTKFDAPQKNTGLEKEEVQLLYVPVESLGKGQLHFRGAGVPHGLGSDIYSQSVPQPNQVNPQKSFQTDFQRPFPQAIENFNFGQDYMANFNLPFRELEQVPKFSTLTSPFPTAPPTTPKPKKLKPHQPPLAVFLAKNSQKPGQLKVGDVLSSLKSAKTVAVLDAVNDLNSPEVFIGPFSLTPPENYVKFELPYLSNIDNTDKQLRHLPFFVAPLSYNTPDGFAKIPFPSPHVGSVVINARIKDTTDTSSDFYTNNHSTSSQLYSLEKTTQKPTVVYYTTSPQTTTANTPSSYQSYSFEPQTVTSVSPQKGVEPEFITAPPKSGYYLNNYQNQYNQQYVKFPEQSNLNAPESVSRYNLPKNTPRTTTTTTTTTTPSSTNPSPLLETHNPYSINHAFHFSTPVDYHNFFEEYKDSYGNPGFKPVPSSTPINSSPDPKPEQVVTEKHYRQQSTPNYLQNYSPEIHYESELSNIRNPIYKPEQNSKGQTGNQGHSQNYVQSEYGIDNSNNKKSEIEYQQTIKQVEESSEESLPKDISQKPFTEIQPTNPTNYNQLGSNNKFDDSKEISSTTTRRVPTRPRGRPRYTTTPRTESNEASVRPIVSRKPLRKPLHRTRPLYDANKITTEKSAKLDAESHESTTKAGRTKARGSINFKSTESDQIYEKSNTGNKDYDLAYQRDVLHQNYPVTLTEKLSTAIETATEPLTGFLTTKDIDVNTEHIDTVNAYTNEKIAVTQHETRINSKEDIRFNKYNTEAQTESSYTPRQTTYIDYQTRSSSAPVEAGVSSYGESSLGVEEYSFAKETLTDIKTTPSVTIPEGPAVTETVSAISKEKSTDQVTIAPIADDTKQETTRADVSFEEQTVHTTPSYNRVRVRPGVIKQYHQASSTETSKNDRRKHVPAVTYRPAFDKRRTTMRIDEIEADLKTKQVKTRPDIHEYRQPVYRPDTTSTTAASSTEETTTRRNNFRRRRPTHTTSSTEASSTKGPQEYRLRQRTRRPIDKTTSKPDGDTSASSTRSSLYNKYTRSRLPEKYNKKTENSEDQDSNYSLKRPQFAAPENHNWSPIAENDSFKPYNPNELTETDLSDLNEHNSSDVAPEIITAKNEYDDILLTVTPASNKIQTENKIPDIPPTLEALIEKSKTTKSDGDMTTFESMLEEVMKSLEEQDKDEYTSRAKVVKHKGGEIGEIPPESVMTPEETTPRITTKAELEPTTVHTTVTTTETTQLNNSAQNEKDKHKNRRRGFWKKVKRPANAESIEVAESQFYGNALNTFGEPVKMPSHDKTDRYDKKLGVTTYKPSSDFLKDVLEAAESEETYNFEDIPVDISKINKLPKLPLTIENSKETTETVEDTTTQKFNPGDLDLGTGSPDPTIIDYTMQTEATTLKRSDSFSFMDYLFGVTASDEEAKGELKDKLNHTTNAIQPTTEQITFKTPTTESSYVPDEISTPTTNENTDYLITTVEVKKENTTDIIISTTEASPEITVETTQNPTTPESSSVSTFMDPTQVISTSMSTEVSHETEICFRGKCFKSKDLKL